MKPVGAWLFPFCLCGVGCIGPVEYDTATQPLTAVQQGVDRAGAFSATEAMKLAAAYPLSFTGVYIGGPCSAGSGWTAKSVTTIYDAVGWSFLPIFVGQQVASICGRDTLTEAQGITDGNAAIVDMNDFQWAPGSHIPVALDLEAGTYSGDESGATSYVKGWADTVSAGGYDVYVYSSVTALNALAKADLPITGAWPAYWLKSGGTYEAGLQPSAAPGLSSAWVDSQTGGAWQYNSGTSVVGAVDYDVANFRMAPAPGQTLPVDLLPQDAKTVDATPDDAAPQNDDASSEVGDSSVGPAHRNGGCATTERAPIPDGCVLLLTIWLATRRGARRRQRL